MTDALVVKGGIVKVPELSDIFLGRYATRGISSWEDIEKIGANNVQRLIVSLRGREKSLTRSIENLYAKRTLFDGIDGSAFIEQAKEFSCPKLGAFAHREDSWDKESIEPTEAADINREHGTTTFNICGWCKFSGGTGRYGYTISGSCRLLDFVPDHGYEGDVLTATPCQLHILTGEQMQVAVATIEGQIASTKATREQVRMGIRKLLELKEDQQDKPYLMQLRPTDYFEIGDAVMLHTKGLNIAEGLGAWMPGKVIFGYRHQEGGVSVCCDQVAHSGPYLNGRGSGSGVTHPGCLKVEEFLYLRRAVELEKDPVFFQIWLRSLNEGRNMPKPQYFGEQLGSGAIIAMPSREAQEDGGDVPQEIKTVKDAVSVLFMLMEPKSLVDLDNWRSFLLKQVHPDKLVDKSEAAQSHGLRYTQAVNAACDLLITELNLT